MHDTHALLPTLLKFCNLGCMASQVDSLRNVISSPNAVIYAVHLKGTCAPSLLSMRYNHAHPNKQLQKSLLLSLITKHTCSCIFFYIRALVHVRSQ